MRQSRPSLLFLQPVPWMQLVCVKLYLQCTKRALSKPQLPPSCVCSAVNPVSVSHLMTLNCSGDVAMDTESIMRPATSIKLRKQSSQPG